MLIDHPESVTIVAVEADTLVVVIQPRPGATEATVELPAGCLEPGEAPEATAARELREECSLAARRWRRLGTFLAAPSYSTERVHVFEARDLYAEAGVPDPDERIVTARRRLSELPGALSDATSIAAFALWRASGAEREAASGPGDRVRN